MGFHCGNTNAGKLAEYEMKYQLIQHRCLEPDKEPDVSRGTLEGRVQSGPNRVFLRLQGTAEGGLKSYVAEGEILPVDPRSFGGIGVFAIPEMGRFYRHVLIAKTIPASRCCCVWPLWQGDLRHHEISGVEDVAFNQPKGMTYPTENPFEK